MLKIGKIYRLGKNPNTYKEPLIDNLPNYYYETHVDGFKNSFAFQKGIHHIQQITGPDGKKRYPLIIISSSPHKAGSDETPWQDKYDPDRGYVRYYGDNKTNGKAPEEKDGNKTLLSLISSYNSGNVKERSQNAVPIIFFERTTVDGRKKGNLKFQGYGIVEKAELVTQFDTNKGECFTNYLFHFCIFTMKEDNEGFDWNWIAKRCDASLTNEQTNNFAPKAWKKWIEIGSDVLHLVRRAVSAFDIVKKEEQIPKENSKEYRRLLDIYKYYDNKKHNFEYLAMEVTKKVIEENGASCTPGWITKKSGDGGIDYVLRIDVGKEVLSGIKIIVLGQAKCTRPDIKTDGRDISRTVARLKRGWIGAFVTTSYFSVPMQQELNEDKYPIMLINGKKVAEIVDAELFSKGIDLPTYLDSLEKQYHIEKRMADDIIYL